MKKKKLARALALAVCAAPLQAYAVPEIDVTPSALDFGEVPVGGSHTIVTTITNSGDTTLSVPHFSSQGSSDFSLGDGISLPPYLIEPGTTIEVPIVYTPSDTGEDRARLTFESDDEDESQVFAVAAGAGVAPAVGCNIDISTLELDFGSVPPASVSDPMAVIVGNTGTADCVISDLSIVGSSDFSSASALPSSSFSIAPGQEVALAVRYQPSADGDDSAVLTVSSDDSDEPAIDASLKGSAPAPVELTDPSDPSGMVDLDIVEFDVDREWEVEGSSPAEWIEVEMEIRNAGEVDEERTATLTAEQDGVVLYTNEFPVRASVGLLSSREYEGEFRVDTTLPGAVVGPVTWTFSIHDDEIDEDIAVDTVTIYLGPPPIGAGDGNDQGDNGDDDNIAPSDDPADASDTAGGTDDQGVDTDTTGTDNTTGDANTGTDDSNGGADDQGTDTDTTDNTTEDANTGTDSTTGTGDATSDTNTGSDDTIGDSTGGNTAGMVDLDILEFEAEREWEFERGSAAEWVEYELEIANRGDVDEDRMATLTAEQQGVVLFTKEFKVRSRPGRLFSNEYEGEFRVSEAMPDAAAGPVTLTVTIHDDNADQDIGSQAIRIHLGPSPADIRDMQEDGEYDRYLDWLASLDPGDDTSGDDTGTVDLDILDFDADREWEFERGSAAEWFEFELKIGNRGEVDEERMATLTAEQEGVELFTKEFLVRSRPGRLFSNEYEGEFRISESMPDAAPGPVTLMVTIHDDHADEDVASEVIKIYLGPSPEDIRDMQEDGEYDRYLESLASADAIDGTAALTATGSSSSASAPQAGGGGGALHWLWAMLLLPAFRKVRKS